MEKQIRLLCILPTLNLCGGIETFCLNYYSKMTDEIIVDYITHENTSNEYKELIEKLGGKLYIMPKIGFKNFKNFKEELKNFFKKHNNYDIIHCNMANAGYFYFHEAKKYGIKIRILHSHQNNYSDKFLHKIRNIPLIFLAKKYSTDYLACSKKAGDFLFGNNPYKIINNAIDAKRFKLDIKKRSEIREKLNLENKFVIGNVGRFTKQKNQSFLICLMKDILSENENVKLLLVGSGELKNELEKLAIKNKVNENIIWLEPTDKINEIYQAMDVFVLPSLYEGLGIVAIEAQTSGLPVIASNNVPEDIRITDLVEFLSLKASKKDWVNKILRFSRIDRKDNEQEIIEKNYSIEYEVLKLKDYYFDLIRKKQ